MSDTIKPCPFCGDVGGTDEMGETYRWRLWKCGCGAHGPDVRCNITGSGQGGVKEARKLAAEAWNQRPLEAVLRNEREVLARWVAEACGVLFSVEEDSEDGGESLRLLRERGLELVRAVLQPAGPNVEFNGVPAGNSSNHPAGGTSAGTQG